MSDASEAAAEKAAARELDLLRDVCKLVLANDFTFKHGHPIEWAEIVAAAHTAAAAGAPCSVCGRSREPAPYSEQKTLNCVSCGRPVPNRLERSWP